ncbi:MAG: hypothetical protein JNK47_01235 [Mesorhizobium sp.]|nr:hypothetical protein [Mesorhizobium sp.]
MDWNAEIEKDSAALRRIVALLFAFAALADRAGAAPRTIRVVVLWLLRAVESISREFVMDVAEERGGDSSLAVLPDAHDIADDASRLVRSFTALATLLAGLIRRSPQPLARDRISSLAGHFVQMLAMPARRKMALSPEALGRPWPDTS